jgi:hypothetical protein
MTTWSRRKERMPWGTTAAPEVGKNNNDNNFFINIQKKEPKDLQHDFLDFPYHLR